MERFKQKHYLDNVYNVLNLPGVVTFAGGNTVTYGYAKTNYELN